MASESLLADKAKLQEELIDHLKLLRLREERLGIIRRDLADSEFELDQLRVALRCTTEYSLHLEADKQAAETVILHVCSELDQLAAAAAAAVDAASATAGPPALTATRATPPPSHLSSSDSAGSSSSSGSTSKAQVWRVMPEQRAPGEEGPGFDEGGASVGAGAAGGRQRHDGVRNCDSSSSKAGKTISTDDGCDKKAQGAGTAAAAAAAVAAETAQRDAMADGLFRLHGVLARVSERLWSVRQQLHGLIVDPAAAAAAAAVAAVAAKTASDANAAAASCPGADDAGGTAPTGAEVGSRVVGSGDGSGSGGDGSPPCPPATPQPAAATALQQLYGLAASKPQRTGGERHSDYDGAVGGLRDWGHRRHAATACPDPAALAGLMLGSRGRCGGGAAAGNAGGGSPWPSPPASVLLTPPARPPALAGLSEALQGWGAQCRGGGGGGRGVRGAVVVQGRRMGAASPPSALSLLSSPTRCSGNYTPSSPAPSPTAAAPPPLSYSLAQASGSAAGLAASPRGGSGDGGAAHDGAASPPPLSAAAVNGVQDPQQQHPYHSQHPEQHPKAQPPAPDQLDSDLVSLRLTNEALQRQVAELQRQNDLLQLRQLGGGGAAAAVSQQLLHHHAEHPQPAAHPSLGPGPSPWGRERGAAAGQGPHAAAAAAAAANPCSSPLAAPYYYGSLPPGGQPTFGMTADGEAPPPPPPPPLLPMYGHCGGMGVAGSSGPASAASATRGTHPTRPAATGPAFGGGSGLAAQEAGCRRAAAPGVDATLTVNAPTAPRSLAATATGPASAAVAATSPIHGSAAATRADASPQRSARTQSTAAAGAEVVALPPTPSAAAAAAVTVPAAAPPGALAARLPPPQGVDAALWELDLLVACSKGAGL